MLILCCYPLVNLPPIGNSLEQFSQNDKTFDGVDAETVLNENVQYSKLPDRPAWVKIIHLKKKKPYKNVKLFSIIANQSLISNK